MTELIVRVAGSVSANPAYFVCVGDDAHRRTWAWLAPELSWPRTNGKVELPDDQLLPYPPGVPEDRVFALLAYWPAWRVTEWAQLEIGSSVLIVGSDGLAEQVAQLCRCRGVLWRAIWGRTQLRTRAEYWIPHRGGQRPDELLRALPGQADSIVVLDGGAEELRIIYGLCRDRGVVVLVSPRKGTLDLNLYPDLHRRGLRIRCGSPFEYGPADVKAWPRAARRINALIEGGLLAP